VPVYELETGIDQAIVKALRSWRDQIIGHPYLDDNGQVRLFDRVLVDAGYRDTAIYEFLKIAGPPFRASMGFGSGYKSSPFKSHKQSTPTVRVGNHWNDVRMRKHASWLVEMDAPYWKRFMHDRFLTPTFNDDGSLRPGSMSLWGSEADKHLTFSHHIVAEIEKEEFIPGKGVSRTWVQESKINHWLDCLYGNCCAADMCGVKLFLAEPVETAMQPSNWFASQRNKRRVA
jgi:hypothetical protein